MESHRKNLGIPLKTIYYDVRARGPWCRFPYPGHPHGCPNIKKGCLADRPDFKTIADLYEWSAVIEEFDLKSHAEYMKARIWADHKKEWTDRQCRNPLYWQGGVRKRLREKAEALKGDIVLDIPEACGIDVFKTMASVGIILERKPDTVRKVMLVGKTKI
jgi:hypothetical protein